MLEMPEALYPADSARRWALPGRCFPGQSDGRVAQHGTHEVLMAEAGLYKELVVRQQAMEVAE